MGVVGDGPRLVPSEVWLELPAVVVPPSSSSPNANANCAQANNPASARLGSLRKCPSEGSSMLSGRNVNAPRPAAPRTSGAAPRPAPPPPAPPSPHRRCHPRRRPSHPSLLPLPRRLARRRSQPRSGRPRWQPARAGWTAAPSCPAPWRGLSQPRTLVAARVGSGRLPGPLGRCRTQRRHSRTSGPWA